jgi:hypothetical protein
MKAGRELDALVAEKVIGWTNLIGSSYDVNFGGRPPGGKWDIVPHYSTSIADAWLVVEKLKTLTADGDIHIECLHGEWSVSTCHEEAWKGWSRADTAPLAICLAALEAVGAL